MIERDLFEKRRNRRIEFYSEGVVLEKSKGGKMFKRLVGKDERVSMLEACRDYEIFMHTLAIAHLKVGGSGVIPDEVKKFIERCYINGIRFKVSLVEEADDYETGD